MTRMRACGILRPAQNPALPQGDGGSGCDMRRGQFDEQGVHMVSGSLPADCLLVAREDGNHAE